MRRITASKTRPLLAAAAALGFSTSSALAGGFEVREQSTFFQGLSFAGAAAQGDSLSSMFWNPATSAMVGPGVTVNSNYAFILPKSDITVTGVGAPGLFAGPTAGLDRTVDIGRDAAVPASYMAWRYSDKIVFAMGMNSQFGLGTKPDNVTWAGQLHARSAKLFTLNINPSVSYEVMPGLTLGAGVQVQYFDIKRFKTADAAGRTVNLTGDDISLGFTLGVNFKPTATTSIGIGYRSKIDHDLDGSVVVQTGLPSPFPSAAVFGVSASVSTPEKVTASFRQEIGSNMRLLGTVEWVNWSRLQQHPVVGAPAPTVLDFGWDDGWFYSLGAELDVNDKLTVRLGGAYEKSPIRNPTQRLVQLPDADRIWASIGGTYKWNEHMSFDFAYSHVFVEEETLERIPSSSPAPTLFANTDSSVDIISLGMTMTLPPLE